MPKYRIVAGKISRPVRRENTQPDPKTGKHPEDRVVFRAGQVVDLSHEEAARLGANVVPVADEMADQIPSGSVGVPLGFGAGPDRAVPVKGSTATQPPQPASRPTGGTTDLSTPVDEAGDKTQADGKSEGRKGRG
jgi:hypothetical protein